MNLITAQRLGSIELNNELRAWILAKLNAFFSKDQCLGNISTRALLSPLRVELLKSRTALELVNNLTTSGFDENISITRKATSDNVTPSFEYPRLSIQISSLLLGWSEIVQLQYGTGENLKKALEAQKKMFFEGSHDDEDTKGLDSSRSAYGNKPNVNLSPPIYSEQFATVEAQQENLLYPLSLDFKYEYNSFRKRVVDACENVREEKKSETDRKQLLYIQSDIQKFYHSLSLKSLKFFFSEKNRNAPTICDLLDDLLQNGYTTLPIGWVFSRFIANFILNEFHARIKQNLQNNIKESMAFKINIPVGTSLPKKEAIDGTTFHQMVSYVDDVIFILSVDRDTGLNPTIIDTTLAEAEQILNSILIGNPPLKLHKRDSSKLKQMTMELDRVLLLKNNFVILQTGDGYIDEDADLRARLTDLLAPADNDIDFNEVGFFRNQLVRLREIIITKDYGTSDKLIETLDTLNVKIEGDAGKYIKSVLSILALILETPELEKHHKHVLNKTLTGIIKSYSKDHKTIPDAIKLITGLYNVYQASDFNSQIAKLLRNAFTQAYKNANKMHNDREFLYLLEQHLATRAAKDSKTFTTKTKEPFGSKLLENLSKCYEGEFALVKQIETPQRIPYGALVEYASYAKSQPEISMSYLTKVFLGQLHIETDLAKRMLIMTAVASFLPKLYIENENLKKLLSQQNYLNLVYANNMLNFLTTNKDRISAFLMLPEIDRLTTITQFTSTLYWGPPTNLQVFQLMLLRVSDYDELLGIALLLSCPFEGRSLFRWFSTKPFLLIGLASYELVRNVNRFYIKPANNFWEIVPQAGTEVVPNPAEYLHLYNNSLVNPDRQDKTIKKVVIDINRLSQTFRSGSDYKKEMKVTLCPLRIDLKKDMDKTGLRFKNRLVQKRIENSVMAGLIAAKNQGSSIVVFPEITIPETSLNRILSKAGEIDIILIAGIEYDLNYSKKIGRNLTVISFPTRKKLHPVSQNYLAFLQAKNFPAADENLYLRKNNLNFAGGNSIIIFKSKEWGDFTVLTCSDYLSLTLRWMVQGEVQTVFVPAQNKDSTTYQHISETCIRDLHALALVCNNNSIGSSFCYAPFYRQNRRTLFNIEGRSVPEFHTFDISTARIRSTQQNAMADIPFRKPDDIQTRYWNKLKVDPELVDFKQLPPDWGRWRKK